MSFSAVQAYALVATRVRAMYGSLQTQSEWERLQSVEDLYGFISLLRDTPYGAYLPALDEHTLTARRVEYEIRKRLADDFYSIYQNSPKAVQPLLNQLFRQFEVDNIKAVLRGLEIGEKYDRIRFMLFPMGRFPTLEYARMAEAGSISSAVEVLNGSRYYSTLSHALDRYHAEHSLFPLEVALDLDLWRNIWRLLNLLKGEDHVQALRLMGMLLDHTNLMWASRYKIFHHLSEEEIINYTLPFGVRVKDRLIRSVASGEDAIPLVAEIYPDLAGLLNEMRDPVRDLPIFEFHLQRRFRDTCQKTFLGDPFHVGILLGYLFLLEMEIQDLTVLLEAKSLGLSSSVYQSYLLFSAADEQIQPGR